MNHWKQVRDFYAALTPAILSTPKNEWASDPYAWDNGMVVLTHIEDWLWADIRACDAVLYPQYPVLNFFVDFANPVAKVAIECDGAAFHQDKSKDAARDQRLRAAGWHVYRITGSDCRKDTDEETRELSAARNFIQRICDRHGISRNSREGV